MLYWFIYFHCFASHRIVFTYIYPLYIRILHAHFKWTAIERNKSLKSTNIFFKAKGAFNVFIGFSCMLISNIFIRLIIINTSIFSTDCRLIISVNACWPFGYWSLHIKSNDIHRKIISMNLYSRIYNIQCWLLTCSHLTISIYMLYAAKHVLYNVTLNSHLLSAVQSISNDLQLQNMTNIMCRSLSLAIK